MLTREQILSAELPTETVDSPEWGGKVRIRALTAGEAADWQDYANSEEKRVGVRSIAGLVAMSLVDEAGTRLFSLADAPQLESCRPTALRRIFDAALRLNALSAPEAEALAKN